MNAIFDDHGKMPVNTVHFGTVGYVDYAVAPHNEDKQGQID